MCVCVCVCVRACVRVCDEMSVFLCLCKRSGLFYEAERYKYFLLLLFLRRLLLLLLDGGLDVTACQQRARSARPATGESVAQSKNTRSRKPKLSTIERGHQLDGYVPGFAPARRFFRSPLLCRLCKSPSNETINRRPLCVYVCRKTTYAR